jgi:hypothetical protein
MFVATCAAVLACGVGAGAQAPTTDANRPPSLQGFTPDPSVTRGQTVRFKVDTDAPAYTITIYQLDESGVAGVDPIAKVPNPPAPQLQPACLPNQETGLVDCSNWSESASWIVPTTAAPGIYVALLERADTKASSQIVFVVQEDGQD